MLINDKRFDITRIGTQAVIDKMAARKANMAKKKADEAELQKEQERQKKLAELKQRFISLDK